MHVRRRLHPQPVCTVVSSVSKYSHSLGTTADLRLACACYFLDCIRYSSSYSRHPPFTASESDSCIGFQHFLLFSFLSLKEFPHFPLCCLQHLDLPKGSSDSWAAQGTLQEGRGYQARKRGVAASADQPAADAEHGTSVKAASGASVSPGHQTSEDVAAMLAMSVTPIVERFLQASET